MSFIPIISGRQAIKAFLRIGYRLIRQRGSHIRLRHPDSLRFKPLTVPDHKMLAPGLLSRLIKDAGLTVQKFIELLKNR